MSEEEQPAEDEQDQNQEIVNEEEDGGEEEKKEEEEKIENEEIVDEIKENGNQNEQNENINLEINEKNEEEIKEKENILEDKNEEKEEEKDIKANNNEIGNISEINQQSEKENDALNKDINILNFKKPNLIQANEISFSKKGYFEENNEIINQNHLNNNVNNNANFYNSNNFNNYNNNAYLNNYINYIPKKSTYQLLNEINNDMDNLSNDLKPIFQNYEIQQNIKYRNKYPLYDYNNENYSVSDNSSYTDEQNHEIKKLIKKANHISNNLMKNNAYNQEYNNRRYYYRDNVFNNHKPKKRKYRYYEEENGGNGYNDYNNFPENGGMDEYEYDDYNNNNDDNYLRNISLEKDINKHRIKKMENIYENTDNYINKPMVYYQREAVPIKNSYMNEALGQPQTSQKIEYSRNNLVFSSSKIPYKKIKYGNISQSNDLLFSNQK